jgi:WD40 repeat protein
MNIASSGLDNCVKVWDVSHQDAVLTTKDLGGSSTALQYSFDGSLIAVTTKSKQMHVLDPRSESSAQVVESHEGIK